jgi:manganese/iron transport system permease protein
MGLVLDPLGMPFMRNGLAEVLFLGLACGLIGPFVVHRRLTFLAHALSHTIFPTVVLAAILRVDLVVGAAAGAAVTLALVLALQRRREIAEDSAVGIAFVGLFALGVVLVGLFRVRSRDVGAALIGNLLGIGPTDLALSAALVAVLCASLWLLNRPLILMSFDRVSAVALGLPTGFLDAVLLVLVAATVIVSVQVVGVILTIATLVTPAATAGFWARGLKSVMLLAAILGATAGVLGLYVAYYVPVAPAGIIVLILSAFFALSALLAPRGLLGQRLIAARAGR